MNNQTTQPDPKELGIAKEIRTAASRAFKVVTEVQKKWLGAFAVPREALLEIDRKLRLADDSLKDLRTDDAFALWLEASEMADHTLAEGCEHFVGRYAIRTRHQNEMQSIKKQIRQAERKLENFRQKQRKKKSLPGPEILDQLFGLLDEGSQRRKCLPKEGQFHVLMISHESSRTGAPLALMNMTRELMTANQAIPWIVLDSGGVAENEFKNLAPTIVLGALIANYHSRTVAIDRVSEWFAGLPGPKLALCCTVMTREYAGALGRRGIPVIGWVHEMPATISGFLGGKSAINSFTHARARLVFPSRLSRQANDEAFQIDPVIARVIYNGLDHILAGADHELSLPQGVIPGSPLVLGCGTIEPRKGTDLFVQVAAKIVRLWDEVSPGAEPPHFVWVGSTVNPLATWCRIDAARLGLEGRLHFVGVKSSIRNYLKRASVVLLPSREESFSLVAFEAASQRIPVIGFRGASALGDFPCNEDSLVPYLDTDAMAQRAIRLLQSTSASPDSSEEFSRFIKENMTWEKCASQFLEVMRELLEQPLVSPSEEQCRHIAIISNGPPPLFPGVMAEGGGLRCWGLARSLKAFFPNARVTCAYNEGFRTSDADEEHDGVAITTWNDANLASLISDASTVIVSYCMGTPSDVIAGSLRPEQQLVLDCYVPIYVEVSARRSANVDAEDQNFTQDMRSWNRVLGRGDVFLCANSAQRNFYTGALSALGRLNPKTYGALPLLTVPYGISRDEPRATGQPCTALVKNPESWKILWFGGIYPWFDLRVLMDAIALIHARHPCALIIVGASNPFVNHPDFANRYQEVRSHAEKPHLDGLIHFVDWVHFSERANWYLDSDITVLVNQLGPENEFAWRTRLVDYIWSGTIVATNGGDPLSDELFKHDAAVQLDATSSAKVAEDLQCALLDKDRMSRLRENLRGLRERYFWDNCVAPLARFIGKHPPGDGAMNS